MKEIPMVWKAEVVSKSRGGAVKYRSYGKYKVFLIGTMISSRHRVQVWCNIYNITWTGSPNNHFLTKMTFSNGTLYLVSGMF